MTPFFRLLQKTASALLFVALLLAGLPAQAVTNYVFSPLVTTLDVLPAGCTYYDSTTYNCASELNLADDDTITIKSPVTIIFGGVFTTGKRNSINVEVGAPSLTFKTNAVFNLGEGTTLVADVVATAAVNLEISSALVGNLTTTSSAGIVVVKANSSVTGSITSDLGAVTLKDDVVLGGSISTEHGGAITVGHRSTVGGNVITGVGDAAVTLLTNVHVKGNIETGAGTITVGDGSTIDGDISCIRAGIVNLGAHVTVNSGIKTLAGGVSMGQYSNIGKPGVSTQAGGVTVWAHSVIDGALTTEAGIVTLWDDTTVKGDIRTGAGGISIEFSSTICGTIYSSTGVLVLTQGIKVGGSVGTGVGTITIGMTGDAVSTVGGNVSSQAALTLTKVWVGGNVTAEGAATLTDSLVRGFIKTGATLNNSTGNVTDLIIPPACPMASAVAGAFECIETGLQTGLPAENAWIAETTTANTTHRLYTKLAGTAFTFDVVALKTGGLIETNYVGYDVNGIGNTPKTVSVELVNAVDGGDCGTLKSLSSPVSLPLTFANVDQGRKTLTGITSSNAYANLRCRVTDANLATNVVACSSDNFSVRPSSATLWTTATAPAPSASSTPAIKAGAAFSLGAKTEPSAGYAGTLKLDTDKRTAQTTSSLVTIQQSGGALGTLTPTSLTANAPITTDATYSEVGYLYLAAGAYRDDSFTAVDSEAGDCITDTTSDNNLLDALVGSTGKYGCSIGNKVGVSLGRFYPDHFAVTSVFTSGCGTAGSSNSFTYMGQPFTLSANVKAKNLNGDTTANPDGGTTQNFSGVFAMATVEPLLQNGNNAIPLSRLTDIVAPGWTSGSYSFKAGGFSRLTTAPDGAYDHLNIGLQVINSNDAIFGSDLPPYLINRNMPEADTTCTADTLGTSNGNCTATKIVADDKVRFGRIKLSNTYGSERLALKMPLAFEYWTSNGWQRNTLDTCSVLNNTNFAFSFPAVTTKTKLVPCDTALTVIGSVPPYVLTLSAPGVTKTGWVNVALNLGTSTMAAQCSDPENKHIGPDALPLSMPWLQFGGITATDNPSARATFGIFKSPLIYRRENY